MWSLGVILYILLCGFPPFHNEDTALLYKQIKKGNFSFPAPYWTDISSEAKDLVKGLLTVNPSARLTPDKVLSHPWVCGGKASDKAIGGGHVKRMALLQSKKVLRRGVNSIIAINRFVHKLDMLTKAKEKKARARK